MSTDFPGGAQFPVPPVRGFPDGEFEQRMDRIQEQMRCMKLDAILLSTEPEVRYFSGFFTQFWQSPTRPWFLILPATGKPIAVIPEIGASGMRAAWVDEIRTWPSPRPQDDGVLLLADTLLSLPRKFGRLGVMLGAESYLRMPYSDFQRLRESLPGFELADVADLLQRQRMIKSEREVAKIRHICQVASASFAALPNLAAAGMSEVEICRAMRVDLLQRGADNTPYIVAGSGPGGYDSIIMGPTDRLLEAGDVLIIDTGSTFDGYYCDFDRNFAFTWADDDTRSAHEVVWDSTEAGFAAAAPGATTSTVWRAMNEVMVSGGSLGNDVGRLGHGLGMQLTERPSNTPDDDTVLEPGMVLTLEPGMAFAPGRQMVHEENIVITADGAEWLSRRASRSLPII